MNVKQHVSTFCPRPWGSNWLNWVYTMKSKFLRNIFSLTHIFFTLLLILFTNISQHLTNTSFKIWMRVVATSCKSGNTEHNWAERFPIWPRSSEGPLQPAARHTRSKQKNQYAKHRNTSKTNELRMGKWSGKWIFKLAWKAFASGI